MRLEHRLYDLLALIGRSPAENLNEFSTVSPVDFDKHDADCTIVEQTGCEGLVKALQVRPFRWWDRKNCSSQTTSALRCLTTLVSSAFILFQHKSNQLTKLGLVLGLTPDARTCRPKVNAVLLSLLRQKMEAAGLAERVDYAHRSHLHWSLQNRIIMPCIKEKSVMMVEGMVDYVLWYGH